MVVKLLVTVGTYEKTVYGVDFKLDGGDDDFKVLAKKSSFSIPAHIGYVKSISSGPQYLVSGSTDETVRIFDLKRRKDYGSLNSHSGSITCMAFYKQKMLFTGGEDGKIIVTRCADWEPMMTLKAHAGGVNSIAVHPSGKLALSSGKDKNIKTWNLAIGKVALKTKHAFAVERIVWSPQGSYYAFLSDRHVQIFATDGAKMLIDEKPAKKILCGAFLTETKLLVAGEGSDLMIHDIQTKSWTTIETAHSPRIKDLQVIEVDGKIIVASGSSNGLMCLWRFDGSNLTLLDKVESGLRITCLTVTTQ